MSATVILAIFLSQTLGQNTNFGQTSSNSQNQDTRLFGLTDGNLGNSLLPGALGFGAGLAASNLIGGASGGFNSGGGCCCGRKKRQAESPDKKLFFGNSGCSCGGVGRRKRQSENTKFFNFGSNQCSYCSNCGGSYNSCRCTSLTSGAGGNCSRDN